MPDDRFAAAIAAIDAANADDPNTLRVRGEERPKELAHAELATEWVRRLDPAASDALLLAARAHHLRRWEVPRSAYPAGRPGYLRWRRDLQARHADGVAEIMRGVGYGNDEIHRVRDLVRKQGLGRDSEVQTLEDALCLVFLETQLEDFAAQHPREKGLDVLRKTLRRMSEGAVALATELDLSGEMHALLLEAQARA